MFEKTKIRHAAAAACVDIGIPKDVDGKYINMIMRASDEGVAALKLGKLKSVEMVVAYTCAGIYASYSPDSTDGDLTDDDISACLEIGTKALAHSGFSDRKATMAFFDLVEAYERLHGEDPEGDFPNLVSDTDKSAYVIESVSQLLEVQFHLGKARTGDGFNSRVLDHYGRGYVFGFIDTAVASALIGMDENGVTVMRGVHNRLFGKDFGSDILDAAFEDQTHPKFKEGRSIGAREFFDFNEEQKPAMGLALYLQQGSE